MTTLPELRAMSSGELRSRVPALERVADGPKTNNAHTQAAAELRRVQKVLQEREAAEAIAATARAKAEEAWGRVATLEAELADARAVAREADAEVTKALRMSLAQ